MKIVNIPLFIFSCFVLILSCKVKSENKSIEKSLKVNSYEDDKKLLEEKLAYTKKIWDSLDYILRQRPSDTIYRNSLRKQFNENKDQQLIVYQNFILENPNSLLSAKTLNNLKFLYGKETTSKLFVPLSEEIRISDIGMKIENFIDLYQNPKINDYFIDFELPNQKGENIKLSEHLEKYTLIEFWASWCVPCRRSNPELVALYEKYKNTGFNIIGVSVDDDRDDWTQAIEEDGLSWENVSDLKGKENTAALKYGITGVPTGFLINEKGIIIAKDISLEILEKKFLTLLKE